MRSQASIKHTDEMTRQQSAHPDGIGDALERALVSGDEWVQEEALSVLPQAAVAEARWRRFLHDSLSDPEPRVRTAAIDAVGRLCLVDEAGELLRLLQDPDDLVRVSAMEALADLHALQAIPVITGMLTSDPSPLVRGYAARAAAELGGPHSLASLQERLGRERSRWAKVQIALALCELGVGDLAPFLLARLRSKDVRIRASIANNIGVVAAQVDCHRLARALASAIARERQLGGAALDYLQDALGYVQGLCQVR